MPYAVTFLEGIMTFISPCLLPMLPVYLSFLAGGAPDKSQKKTILNALGFVVGFSTVFILLGAAAATFGMFVKINMKYINIIGGCIVILFGLNFSGLFHIDFLNRTKQLHFDVKSTDFFSSVLFGAVFSIGWTPCIGTFLGTALMQAANSKTVLNGVGLLVTYCIGLGIPFILSAVFIRKLQGTFVFIKRNYKIINLISGMFLICLGILMMTGRYYIFLGLFS